MKSDRDEMDIRRILERIDRLLLDNKRSYSWLAMMIDAHCSTVSSWFNRNSCPSIYHLVRIAEVFDVSIDYLLYGHTKKYDTFVNLIELQMNTVKSCGQMWIKCDDVIDLTRKVREQLC